MTSISGALAAQDRGPVRVWGELSSAYRVRESVDGDSENTNWLNTGTISASSYIWRPWFALVNGSLSLSVEENEDEGQGKSQDEFATGDFYFSLFPTSRFPFRAYYIEGRDQFDNNSLRFDIETTEYGVSQQYRSLDGRHNYLAEFENNQQDNSERNNFTAESLLLSADDRIGDHVLETDLKRATVDSRSSDERAETYSITLDHFYGDKTNWSIENLLSTSSTENDFSESSNDIETSQLSSFASWHPRNRKDLKLTGSLRLSETRQQQQSDDVMVTDAGESEAETANLNQGLVYDYSDNLQLSESINANYFEDESRDLFTANEALAARYTSDRVGTGLGDYGWSAGTAYNNVHGDVEREHSLATQFSHSLLNDYSNAGEYQLRSNLTQSFTYTSQSEREDEKSIDHSYSITWSNTALKQQNLVRLFISDSRSLNRDDDNFQLVNLQYTGANSITRYSQLSGNATLQYSRQETEGMQSEQTVSNGQLEYRRSRVFQLPGMFFISLLKLSERQSETERLIEDNDSAKQASWENSLLYRIGRLEAQLDIDFIKIGNDYDRLFMFQLTRSFGDL
ncbi:MAG: hypothetical protein OES20_13475 [Gammaproteobacteria bacterium]|nr:hypothetical protein [Gammaproteobacteria bacterium]MDH3856735.1 hypothetical protein [Gammaproteobacteria bacterium]